MGLGLDGGRRRFGEEEVGVGKPVSNWPVSSSPPREFVFTIDLDQVAGRSSGSESGDEVISMAMLPFDEEEPRRGRGWRFVVIAIVRRGWALRGTAVLRISQYLVYVRVGR